MKENLSIKRESLVMSVEFKAVKCPECGANLSVEEGREKMFCSYCGAQIMLVNENEHIYRHIDEADVKKAETDQMVRMKKMEIFERFREEKEKRKLLKIKICLVLGVIAILSFIIGQETVGGFCIFAILLIGQYLFIEHYEDNDLDVLSGDIVKVPSAVENFERKNYTAMEAEFMGAGFTNVKSVPLNDLTFGLIKRPGMVASISINGKEITSGGKKCSSDAKVIISYHSYG